MLTTAAWQAERKHIMSPAVLFWCVSQRGMNMACNQFSCSSCESRRRSRLAWPVGRLHLEKRFLQPTTLF